MEKATSSVSWNTKTFHWSIHNFFDVCGIHQSPAASYAQGNENNENHSQEYDCLLDIDFLQSPVIEVGSPDEEGFCSKWILKLAKSIQTEGNIDFQMELVPEESEEDEPSLECFFKYSVELLGTNGETFHKIEGQKIVHLKNGQSWSEPGFLKTNQLQENYDKLIEEDTLNLKIELFVLNDLHHSRSEGFELPSLYLETQPTKKRKCWNDVLTSSQYNHSKDLFSTLWKSRDVSGDASVLCGDSSFKVHKLILSSASPVFAATFKYKNNDVETSESLKNTIVITDMSAHVAEIVLRFIYCDTNLDECVWKNVEDLTEILDAAETYQMVRLKSLCFSRLCDVLSLNSAGHVAILVHLYEPEPLVKNFVHQYILKNMAALREMESFKAKMAEVPAAFTPLLLITKH